MTRTVVPRARATLHSKAARLYPEFEVDGVRLIMLATDFAGVGKSEIGVRVGSLKGHRDTIRDALDFAFQGF